MIMIILGVVGNNKELSHSAGFEPITDNLQAQQANSMSCITFYRWIVNLHYLNIMLTSKSVEVSSL